MIKILLLSILYCSFSIAQVNYEPLSKSIYNYLDRLSTQGYIQINSEIKPFSRAYIAEKLKHIMMNNGNEISSIEKSELLFYIQEYSHELKNKNLNVDSILSKKRNKINLWNISGFNKYGRLHLVDYNDLNFSFILDPIYGYNFSTGQINSKIHRWNGLSIYGSISDFIAFDLNFRDNSEKGGNIDYDRKFSPETGYSFRKIDGNTPLEYDEVNANLTFSSNWGHITLGKDYNYYGEGETGNLILGSKAPSFPQIKIEVYPTDWFKFSYIHGFLNSQVIDSSTIRFNESGWESFKHIPKYFVAHQFSFTPWTVFNFTLGESIVYSDSFEPIYLIPVMFFRLADHYLTKPDNAAGNAQLFGSFWYKFKPISTKIYGSIFIDELSVSNSNNPKAVGYTLGTKIINPFIPESELVIEYTKIEPFVYFHRDDAQFYTNYNYQLGHWVGSNSDQFFISLKKRFIRGLDIKFWYSYIRRGQREVRNEPRYLPTQNFLYGLKSYYKWFGLELSYEVIQDAFVNVKYLIRDNSFEQTDGTFLNDNKTEFNFSVYYGL